MLLLGGVVDGGTGGGCFFAGCGCGSGGFVGVFVCGCGEGPGRGVFYSTIVVTSVVLGIMSSSYRLDKWLTSYRDN